MREVDLLRRPRSTRTSGNRRSSRTEHVLFEQPEFAAQLRRGPRPANFRRPSSAPRRRRTPRRRPVTPALRAQWLRSASAARNLAIGPLPAPRPRSSRMTSPAPARLRTRAQSFSLSKKLRGCAAAPGAGMARTTAPFDSLAKARHPSRANTSLTSAITSGLRRSGLSDAVFQHRLAYGMREKGVRRPACRRRTPRTRRASPARSRRRRLPA